MKKRLFVKVFGEVHGVSYRYFCRKNAKELGLTGYCQNIPEGVEAVFEGEEKKLKKMLELCRKGPAFARVEKVVGGWLPYKNEFADFTIKYSY